MTSRWVNFIWWRSLLKEKYRSIYNQIVYRRTSTYKLSRYEQFVFTNIARTNKLRLPIHLTNTEPSAYEHFKKWTLTNIKNIFYEKKSSTYQHSTCKQISKNALCWVSPIVGKLPFSWKQMETFNGKASYFFSNIFVTFFSQVGYYSAHLLIHKKIQCNHRKEEQSTRSTHRKWDLRFWRQELKRFLGTASTVYFEKQDNRFLRNYGNNLPNYKAMIFRLQLQMRYQYHISVGVWSRSPFAVASKHTRKYTLQTNGQ
jgi:hypothetical protein